jgi:hypothetical protein
MNPALDVDFMAHHINLSAPGINLIFNHCQAASLGLFERPCQLPGEMDQFRIPVRFFLDNGLGQHGLAPF